MIRDGTQLDLASGPSALAWLDPIAAVRHYLRHRELIAQLVRREIGQRYQGSMLGFLWSFLQPLILLGVYTFIFLVVFGAEWPSLTGETTANFALIVFSGLITFNVFSETVNASPRLILANANFVKRVAFPLEVLPLVRVTAALSQAAVSLGVLVVALVAFGAPPGWTALLLPLVWLPLALFALGLSFLLSSLGVFVRDLEQVIGVAVTALFFGSAIFYPVDRVPEPARRIIEWLPTAVFVEDTRRVMLYGATPFRAQTAVVACVGLAVALLGFACFMRSKRAFADVV